uniref:Uncharacterized protein n=1 Tax=Magallana gigas TaxID=29159 RepID=A0A8W8MC81_MAGGI|nr:uncharacterized protein LOC117683551 isoform X2 [Crassostrea gigas]|eukprot:XP_019922221.1 PREDICTED: uncharacterized protein LOC109618596 [Crassostrea gigas]
MNPSFGILLCLAIFSVVELGHCRRYERLRPECPILDCAKPPENCRTEVVYDDGCPEACVLVCECPKPSPLSLEYCENTNPRCSVEEDFLMLANGKRCFNGCVIECGF